jgi:hypothetical protein
MELSKKYLLIIDAIFVVLALITVFFLVGYSQPLAIAPLPNDEQTILFRLPQVDYILLDQTSGFDSPKTIFIDQEFSLTQGKYFIKFYDGLKSEIREIEFQVDVVLELRRMPNGEVGVYNTGENSLLVDVYNTGSLVDSNLVGGKDE